MTFLICFLISLSFPYSKYLKSNNAFSCKKVNYKISLCSLWLIAFLGISINAFSQDFLSLEEHQLLESELKLAKTPQLYFIFDFKKKEILIKSKGAILKELKIDAVRFWGQHVKPEPYTLIKKSALLKPKREEIKPKKEEDTEETTGTFDIKALELSDMPSSYRLTLKKGIVITIRPTPEGIFSTIFNAVSLANWYLSRPLLTLWNYLMGKPFTAVYLTLQKEDARSLYWSFTEGAESIIYNPYP